MAIWRKFFGSTPETPAPPAATPTWFAGSRFAQPEELLRRRRILFPAQNFLGSPITPPATDKPYPIIGGSYYPT